MAEKKKVVIVGAGSAGYVCAIRASQLGAQVTVIEKDSPGGTCVNAGCIPTKTFIESAELLENIQNAASLAVKAGDASIGFPRLLERKEKIIQVLRNGIQSFFAKNHVSLVAGTVTQVTPGQVRLQDENGNGKSMDADAIVIATGSAPSMPRPFSSPAENVITSAEALNLEEAPRRFLIVGGGAIGVEFAYMFSAFGSEVTVVEQMERLIPSEDNDSAGIIAKAFARRNIKIHTGEAVDKIEPASGGLKATLSSGTSINCDKLLVATGRVPNTAEMGLDELGILDDRGRVRVNSRMQTAVGGILAIGDAVPGPMYAHKASAEGMVAAENIMGGDMEMDYRVVPRCIYTNPEVAAVGLTEQDAKAGGKNVTVKSSRYSTFAKAWVTGNKDGMMKIVADSSTDEILGIHITGERATDLIGEAVMAMESEATPELIGRAIHPHPTFCEGLMETARKLTGTAIHT